VGIASVYPASPEVANLFHAHVGDPEARTESTWDSPSGRVYSWRWSLGRSQAAFYAPVVRKKATFLRWSLLAPVLRLVADRRTPDELYDTGAISAAAYRIARVLEAAETPVSTGDIRREADFPAGRESGAAYHKALAELDDRLLITSEFMDDEGQKHHGLIYLRHRNDIEAADAMPADEAMILLLRAYLPAASYIVPAVLARHLRLDKPLLDSALEGLCSSGEVMPVEMPGQKGAAYAWTEALGQPPKRQ